MSRFDKFWLKRWLIVCVTLILAVGVSPLLAQTGDPRFQPATCPLPIPAGVQVDCGYLTVAEDHARPDGTAITLAVAVLHSSNPQPQPDPVLFLQGGPGGPAIYYVLQDAWLRALQPILAHRDVIVFDPRGTGFSSPSLVCPEQLEIVLGGETTLTMLPDADRDAGLNEALFQCRDRLITEGIDLTTYTAVQNAGDVALIREALGYEQVNLLGLSYGTRLALTVMRDHPEGIRSVILDSTLPYDLNLVVEEPLATAGAVEAVLALCQSDMFCRMGYPDLHDALFKLIDDLNTAPLSFTATASEAGVVVNGVVSGDSLAQLLFGLLYNRVSVGFIPALVYTLREGDTDLLEKIIFPPGAPDPAGFSSAAVQYAVICSDYAPYGTEPSAARDESIPAIFGRVGLFGSGAIKPICERWGDVVSDTAARQPVESDIPTLLLSGGLDHATPPVWAQRAAETLPNGHVVLFPTMTHSLIFSGETCPAEIAAGFLDQPTTSPATDCIGAIRPPEFTVAVPASRPYLSIAALALGTVALWNVGVAGRSTLAGGHRRFAWRMSLRLVGFVGLVASLASMTLLYLIASNGGATGFPMATTARFIEMVVPLIVGVQAAFLFSPDDEPGIEVLMACPRPVSWLLVERLLVLIALQSAVALTGVAFMVAVGGERDVVLALVRWFAPSLFFGGVATYVTIRSRQPVFGAGVAGLLWFVFAFMGAALLPYTPTFYPLSLIQPFLWSFHAYLQPGDVSVGDYWLNRVLLAVLGVVFILLAVRLLRDEERILTGIRARSQ